MGAFRDISGNVYGYLTVVRFSSTKKFKNSQTSLWECKCICGGLRITATSALKSGSTTSCGCKKQEQAVKGWNRRGRKHGLSEHPLYGRWVNMIRRCYSPVDSAHRLYGAKGITVCDDWRFSPDAYIAHFLALGWIEGLSIDRIDGTKNYCPENTRLATPKIQANNTNRNRVLCYLGESKTLSEWAEETGISYGALQARIYRKWEVYDALNTPVRAVRTK